MAVEVDNRLQYPLGWPQFAASFGAVCLAACGLRLIELANEGCLPVTFCREPWMSLLCLFWSTWIRVFSAASLHFLTAPFETRCTKRALQDLVLIRTSHCIAVATGYLVAPSNALPFPPAYSWMSRPLDLSSLQQCQMFLQFTSKKLYYPSCISNYTKSSCPTDSMHVRVEFSWKINVDHQVDPVNVNTPSNLCIKVR